MRLTRRERSGHTAAASARRRSRESTLVASDQSYLWHAFSEAPDGIAIVRGDSSGTATIVRANRSFGQLLGRSPEELVGSDISAHTHPDDLTAAATLMDQLVAGKAATVSREKRYVRLDGAVVHTLWSASLVRDDRGAPTYAIVHVKDIGDRKRAEEAQRRSDETFRAAFAASLDAIVIVDDDRRQR